MTGYKWRAVSLSDLPSLARLDAACLEHDGPASIASPAYDALIAEAIPMMGFADEADIVAVGWVQPQGASIRLGGTVHPAYRRRGLGGGLLDWCEGEALRQKTDAVTSLIIRNEAFTDDSGQLYERHGFKLDFVEHWMARDLREVKEPPDDRFTYRSWTRDNAPQFFEVYRDAFRERPGFPDPSAEEWIADYVEDEDFSPEWSLLALTDSEAVGFITAGEMQLPQAEIPAAWISQVGVRPLWRGRGVGAALIARVMESSRRAGYGTLGLHVNANNGAAIRLYEQLGFIKRGRRAKYSKRVLTPDPSP